MLLKIANFHCFEIVLKSLFDVANYLHKENFEHNFGISVFGSTATSWAFNPFRLSWREKTLSGYASFEKTVLGELLS